MANPKPFVAAACIAEHVLIEKDDVASIIRIADTFFVTIPPDLPEGVKPAIVLTAYISLKSGDVKGTYDIELLMRSPSRPPHSFGPRQVVFEGGIHGANIKLKLDLRGIEVETEYWLDVLWGPNKELLTSVPFRFKQQAEQSTPELG